MLGYQIIEPTSTPVPIVVSVPHCGTLFPSELISDFNPKLAATPDDTDWFVDKLYDFAPAMGITMITAQYSRWVVDLNRDPHSKPLYTDGRIITALCPTTDFLGNPIYVDNRTEVATEEVARRVEKYYWPYHQKLQELLKKIHAEFGCVLLWDCHSIRQYVPTIRKEKFPDLILGDADETSCSKALIETSLKNLSAVNCKLQHNDPFKGGYITRAYGNPKDNFFALQLEMSKVNYMDDTEQKYHDGRAEKVREVLKKNFEELIVALTPSPLPLSRGRGVSSEKVSNLKYGKRTHEKIPETLLQNARSLRKQPTQAEQILWERLRDGKLNGIKFRRQHPFEGFILDFYCDELRLAIEVDGEIHLTKENLHYDKLRTEYLYEFGIAVLRFKNFEVTNEIESVLKRIEEKANEIKP